MPRQREAPNIELGYDGVTVEQVLEQRLRRSVREPKATAARALAAVKDAIANLGGSRFTEAVGPVSGTVTEPSAFL